METKPNVRQGIETPGGSRQHISDDAMAAQGLASLHLPLSRSGYDRNEISGNHPGFPPSSPALRVESASPSVDDHNRYPGSLVGRTIHGLPTSRPHSPSNLAPGALPGQPGGPRPTSPMSIERLSSPSPLGVGTRTLNALQSAAIAAGLQAAPGNSSPLGAAGSGNPALNATPGRESPLARNRSWALGGTSGTPSGLGLASLPHSRAGSRGLDSPISHERSGGNDDDDSPDSGGQNQDYFGRYTGAASGSGGGGAGASRLREESGIKESDDDDTPPAHPQANSTVEQQQQATTTNASIDPSLGGAEERPADAQMEVDQS